MAIGGMGGTEATGNAYTYNPNWCGNMLPCGWCKELGMMCPLQGATYPNQPFTYGTDCPFFKVTRPPQSWCYVEG